MVDLWTQHQCDSGPPWWEGEGVGPHDWEGEGPHDWEEEGPPDDFPLGQEGVVYQRQESC